MIDDSHAEEVANHYICNKVDGDIWVREESVESNDDEVWEIKFDDCE